MNILSMLTLEIACYIARCSKGLPGHWRLIRWLWQRAESGGLSALPAKPRTMAPQCKLFLDPRDFDGRRYLVNGFTSLEPISALFHSILRPGDIAVDVGANVGYFSALGSRLVGATGSVIAIEASPTTAARLRTLQENSPANVCIHEIAVSDSVGSIDFYVAQSDHSGIASLRDLGARTATKITVPTNTLDNLLFNQPPVRLIKIDVEGAEFKVLTGAKAVLARDHPFVVLELTPSFLRSFGHAPDNILALAKELGYKCWRVGQRLTAFSGLAVGEFQCDVLLAPLDSMLADNHNSKNIGAAHQR